MVRFVTAQVGIDRDGAVTNRTYKNNCTACGKKIDLFRALPAVEQRILMQALLVLPFTHLGLRLIGVQWWYALLRYGASFRARSVASLAQIELTMARAIGASLHPGNCLSRSLTLWWLLQRQGIAAEIQIGVRTGEQRFQAHAWVEVQGTPCGKVSDVRQYYTAFAHSPFAQRG